MKKMHRVPKTRRRPRRGVSLIEILVAVVMLAVVLAFVGRASMAVNAFDHLNSVKAKRELAMQQQLNLIGVMSYPSLSNTSVLPLTKTFTSGDFTYIRRIRLTPSATGTRVRLTIVPQTGIANDTLQQETLSFTRTPVVCGTVLFTC